MNAALRHYCRNPRCRSKLPAPVENHHHAFCTRGCHSSFFRSRCLVCEAPMQRKREGQRFKSGHKTCEQEYRRFPRAFDYLAAPDGQSPAFSEITPRSAHSTGIKFGLAGHRPGHRSLRDWWWGDPGIGDLSLYDKDGLTLTRLVLADGRYRLRSPVTWPRMSWPDLEEAKHHAESLALSAIPLASVDPKLAARIKRDNSTPHPMGPPLNRPWPVDGDGDVLLTTSSKITEAKTDSGIDTSIPDFLRRAPCGT
jgi:hypothetical protein